MDKNIIEWMVENKIASNGFQAAHISEGLHLPQHPRAAQEAMCKLYRRWRAKTDKKNDIHSWQAYQLVIAGIDPDSVMPRQIDLFEVAK